MLRALFSEEDLLAITRSLALRPTPITSPGNPQLTMDIALGLFPDKPNEVLARIKQREQEAMENYRPGRDNLLRVLVTLE